MAELWNEVDGWLVDLITADLGTGNTDLNGDALQVQSVYAVPLTSQRDWADWTLPAVAVVGVRVQYTPGAHDADTVAHHDTAMPYTLAGIVEGSQTTAHANAKTLLARMVRAVSTFANWADAPVGDAGDLVHYLQPRRAIVSTVRKPGDCEASAAYWGVALLEMEGIGETE